MSSFETTVLQAMLRLARRREAADEGNLSARLSGTPADLRRALRRLEQGELIERRPGGQVRLTLPGFAIAVALLPRSVRSEARRMARAA
jgi:Mn-dependent DtxR family transcriptional regulator